MKTKARIIIQLYKKKTALTNCKNRIQKINEQLDCDIMLAEVRLREKFIGEIQALEWVLEDL